MADEEPPADAPEVPEADAPAADDAAPDDAPDDPADEQAPPDAPDDDAPDAPADPPAPDPPVPQPDPPAVIPPPPMADPAPVAVAPAPVEEAPKPVERTFTAPSGQVVTVAEHPDAPPPEEVKPLPVAAPVEYPKPPVVEKAAEAAVVAAPVAAVVAEEAKPADPVPVVEKKATIVAAPAAVVEEKPATVVEPAKPDPPAEIAKPVAEASVAAIAVAAVAASRHKVQQKRKAGKLKAKKMIKKSSSKLGIRDGVSKIKAAHTAINAPKTQPVVTPAVLDHPIGIFKEYIAPAEMMMSLQQHIYSVSGNDFTVLDDTGKKKMFRMWGKIVTASARMHMSDCSSNFHLCDLRKKPFKILSSWYTDGSDRNKLEIKSQLALGTRTLRINFVNYSDNKPVDLFLKGHFADSKGALVHLGKDEKGPVVARIERDAMNPRQILHGKQTYHLHVMRNFDYALACLICVAFEDRSPGKPVSTLALKK